MSWRVVDPPRLDRLVGPPPRPYLHAAKIKSRFPKNLPKQENFGFEIVIPVRVE
jgi:hypothetical protein